MACGEVADLKKLDTHPFSAGIYFIRLTTQIGTNLKKIVALNLR